MEDVALVTTNVPIRFWRRYMNDTYTALPASCCQQFLEPLNSIETSIQFTLEKESEGKLPFLDVHLEHHSDGSISTTVFQKPTHTYKYLDFTSHHPLAHKMAVVRKLQHRAGTISSTIEAHEEEKDHVVSALLKNGYSKWFIHKSASTRRTQCDAVIG